MKNYDVIIVGGGASGLLAAYAARSRGLRTAILEKKNAPGKKLAITGKGRCNLTTACDLETSIAEFGKNGRFLRSSFSNFFSSELISLFESLGIKVTVERGKRVFPLSMRAPEIVNRIRNILEQSGVNIITNSRVKDVTFDNNNVTGVEASSGHFITSRVILATGGASYPATGSTGDGYEIASHAGHSVTRILPALVPIELIGTLHRELSPLSLKNVKITLCLDDKSLHEEFGEMSFTEFGATGPAILPFGKLVAKNKTKDNLSLSVNFKPALTAEQLDARVRRDLSAAGSSPAVSILKGLLPLRAIPTFTRLWKIPSERTASQVTKKERGELVDLLSNLTFNVKGTRPIDEAIVTAGGVSLNEINPRTMESKILHGLYICGELLDLDAGTGGFNLQAAFSTGWTAGSSV